MLTRIRATPALFAALLCGFSQELCREPPVAQQSPRSHGNDSVRVELGTDELVFDHSRQACERRDASDVPAAAVRLPDGEILLISGNQLANYGLRGPSFSALRRDCARPPMPSPDIQNPQEFSNRVWLAAAYRVGDTIHALVHNEYHDPKARRCKPGDSSPLNPCWYNAITYAYSVDGGRSYQRPPAPKHVVAAPAVRWDAASVTSRSRGERPFWQLGYFNPTNIVRGKDGYYYSMFRVVMDANDPEARGICPARTKTLGDPSSWRAWDGSGYTVRMSSPYEGGAAPSWCTPVSRTTVRGFSGSLSYNTYLDRYLLVGPWVETRGGQRVCGFYYATSPDLVTWSSRELLMEGPVHNIMAGCRPGANSDNTISYPSLIEHGDTTVNFERTGQTPYLYYSIRNRGPDRDLRRVALRFVR